MLGELAPGARTVTLRFISDREMRRLNADFRHKDRPTDVLSFPGDYASEQDPAWPAPERGHLGDDAAERDRAWPLPELGHLGDDAAEQDPTWPLPESGHLGDIAVAVPTARRQAAERGHGAGTEIRLLVLHGLLHCLGYDHERDGGEMESLERRLRRRYLPEAAA